MTAGGKARPFAGGFHLDVGAGHRVWVETQGDAGGMPCVYLHGGPGSGCQPSQRALFDPDRSFAVFCDQRGAGRSTPPGGRHANKTDDLVADLEQVREALGIARWLVVGGSWGATLGLAYAEAHPERVIGLVLRAVFLGTRAELDRAFGAGMRQFHPQLHADFLALLAPEERDDPLPAYWRRILSDDESVSRPAALAWHDAERVLSELRPAALRMSSPDDWPAGRPLPRTPFMEAHYFSHECFLAPGALLNGADRLAGVPGIIVQGRYDLLCPPDTSEALVRRWPEARVVMVEAAGHALSEPGVAEAVKSAIAEFTGAA